VTAPVNARPSYNPFSQAATEAVSAQAEHVAATRQAKPWGQEVIFADGSHGYVGKLITVMAGQSLSLQLHQRKDETISVVSGEVLFESGPSADDLESTTMLAGDTVHVPPTAVHRITAVTDILLVEVSTAGPGWREDIVRLADVYGREGTSAP
jgi:mannose-6-phosphate isomerase-like protein (cupin superfamily)